MLQLRLIDEQWVWSLVLMSVKGTDASIRLDVNRKDYRAWYGLGQAYELLSMHHYALHYYQHATALRCVFFTRYAQRLIFVGRPYDVRLWQAQGICYEEIRRYGDFIHINVCFIYIYTYISFSGIGRLLNASNVHLSQQTLVKSRSILNLQSSISCWTNPPKPLHTIAE